MLDTLEHTFIQDNMLSITKSKVVAGLKQIWMLSGKRFAHTERKVKVHDVDLNILECGGGSESLLLMPGIYGSIWSDFAPQIEQLPKLLPNHKIIAWDPPGYGKSIPPERKWDLDCNYKDAKYGMDLMKALNITKFSILGWSAGGTSGLIMASRYAEQVEKLVIWGAGAYMSSDEVKYYQTTKDVRKWPIKLRERMEQIYGADKFPRLWSELVDSISKLYLEREGDLCKGELSKIKAPTFILHGKKDIVKPWEHIPYLREHIQNTRYAIF